MWLATGLAAEHAPVRAVRYNDDELRLLDERPTRADLVAMGRRVLKDRGIQVRFQGEVADVAELPDEALGALWVASEDGRSVHYDLRMPDRRGVPRPVSVRIDGNLWTVSTRSGAARQPVDPTRLQAEFEAAGLVVRPGGRPWEAHVAEAVVLALSKLTPAERQALKGVGIARAPGRGSDGNKAATYHTDGAWIAIYDPAAEAALRFVGTPSEPYAPASLVILHELAHAIADRPLRGILVEHERQRQEAMADQQKLKVLIDRHNAELRAYQAEPTDAEATRLQAQEAQIREKKQAISAVVARLNRAVKAFGSSDQRTTPMGAAYGREVGHPVTTYGETSVDEAFAEAFALYHLDPEALDQVAPGALAWFRAGQHLADP